MVALLQPDGARDPWRYLGSRERPPLKTLPVPVFIFLRNFYQKNK